MQRPHPVPPARNIIGSNLNNGKAFQSNEYGIVKEANVNDQHRNMDWKNGSKINGPYEQDTWMKKIQLAFYL